MQQNNMIDIDQILRIAKKHGLTQEQLCEKAGVHRCIIHRIRKGKSKPRLATIHKLIMAAYG